MEIRENNPDYYYTAMDIHVTINKEIIVSQKTDQKKHYGDPVLSLSASKTFLLVEPAKLQDTLLAVKNYTREFNRHVNEMFLQGNENENSEPELKTL